MPLPGSRALTASLFLLGAGSIVAALGWLPEFLRITRFSGEPAILALTIAGPILVLVLSAMLRSSARKGLPAGRDAVVCIVVASLALPATIVGGASAAVAGAFGDALLLLASMLSLLLLMAGLILAIVGAARLPNS